MARSHRVDGNQALIVRCLRDAGRSVAITSGVGDGFPDLVVGGATHCQRCGSRVKRTVLLEVKDPTKPLHDQKLTQKQERFHNEWKGDIQVVKTIGEALRAAGVPIQ